MNALEIELLEHRKAKTNQFARKSEERAIFDQ